MKTLVVLIVVLCGVSLAKHIVNPLEDIQIASVYDLCSNSDTTCITSDSSCIDSKSCENLIVIEADEDAGFAYHLLTTGHQYVSLGFSHDKSMGTEMCVSCVDTDGAGTLSGVLSHNAGKKNIEEESQDELNVLLTQKEDTTIYCKFTLNNTLNFARKIDNGTDSQYYVVGVSGNLASGQLGKHGRAFISEEMVTFGPSVGTENFYDMCKNESITCVGAWSKSESEDGACLISRNCTKAFAVEPSGDNYLFHLFGVDVSYMAIAFSEDQKMGSDSVIACVINGTEVAGILSHNQGYENTQSESNEGLIMKEAKVEDGTIYCSFTLKDIVGYARTLEDTNADSEFYIIGAGGILKEDGISLGHHSGHLMTNEKLSFASSAATITSSLLLAIFSTLISLR